MKIHNITKDDMRNGDGLRVVLWVAGCEHHCKGCQNPVTWDPDDGVEFMASDMAEIMSYLDKDYISGLTISGGDPLYPANRNMITWLCRQIRHTYPGKTIWIYTGYLWEEVADLLVMEYIDVLVDGPFIQDLASVPYHWAGSTNQRVIDVPASLAKGEVILWN